MMDLVVDANELFAALITGGRGRRSWVLDVLFSADVNLFAPYRLLVELRGIGG